MNNFCARCGSEDHNVNQCRWPIMTVFVMAGAALSSCLMLIVGHRP